MTDDFLSPCCTFMDESFTQILWWMIISLKYKYKYKLKGHFTIYNFSFSHAITELKLRHSTN